MCCGELDPGDHGLKKLGGINTATSETARIAQSHVFLLPPNDPLFAAIFMFWFNQLWQVGPLPSPILLFER
jgi:hypothetical protein